ncbi:AraC family transcriptional regulator [Fulvivirga sp. M361]|uniref:helix-turn-helix domain-containing protein n=1 Tax=Fulvivirga sp. M361 TaxID=2594266 RepID=UPI00117A7032|nr:helix-turn-helix domain-containing protein [Fulvivirga sp. M361]TRX48065.1 AraC family transcriptional regulator [Fulvivirga sp. M361]
MKDTQGIYPVESIGTFWFAEKEAINVTSLTIPFLQHELLLNLGDVLTVNNSLDQRKLIFSGIQTDMIHTHASGKYRAFGILFDPTKVYQVYGLSIAEFTSHMTTTPDHLLFNKTDEFFQRVSSVTSTEERLNTFSDFFLQNAVNKTCPPVIDDFIIAISDFSSDNSLRINKIADELNYTSKHLINVFKDVVGITPKKYFQIGQLNLAARKMWHHPTKTLTQLALECGFYDQSHFIRTFKKFTRLTPSEFRYKQIERKIGFPNTILK